MHRQLDFWVGTWDVFTPNGAQAGTNQIEQLQGGCLITEHWTGAGGSHGRSMNYYDPAAQQWKQVWVDSFGGHITFSGTFHDGAMHLEGVSVLPNGNTALMKMSFTPQDDGSVRQYIEQSTDDGETWTVWFDGKYVRRAE